MSSLSFAVVAEGPTDVVVIEAALRSIYGERVFRTTLLQPQDSLAFGGYGGGWPGVYKWCAQNFSSSGAISAFVESKFDALILHLDADVAGFTYASGNIDPRATDLPLPCEQACPLAVDTCNSLRAVLISWFGGNPIELVVCMPSKSTEAWVVASIFPDDSFSTSEVPECHPNPESRLTGKKLKKRRSDYIRVSGEFEKAWPALVANPKFPQALAFQDAIRAIVP